MDKRKSLAHILADNANSPTAGSLRRRSSIRPPPSIEIAANDDELERRSLRLEANTSAATTSSRRSLSLGVTSGMSSPQIEQGIQECIKLNTQNKINMKNAFSLGMIDYMSWMVKNREGTMSNLQVAAAGLDASAKVYAMRVDRLHHDILSMAANLNSTDQKPREENDNENAADPEAPEGEGTQTLRQKKKKKNMKILTTMEALQGEKETVSLAPIMFGETDCQTSNTLYQAMLPQHCSESLVLHAYNDVVVDDESVTRAPGNNNTTHAWPPCQPSYNTVINAVFSAYEFLNWSSEKEEPQDLDQNQSLETEQLAFDLDASLPPDNMPAEENFFEMPDDVDESQVACHAERQGPVRIATLENIIDAIPSRRLEYSLFDTSLDIRWAGPSYWKIKSFIGNMTANKAGETCTQNPMKKRRELTLEYSEQTIQELGRKYTVTPTGKTKLKASTVKYNWSEDKITLQNEETSNTLGEMKKFYLRSDETLNFARSTDADATVLDDDADRYNYDNPNDTIDYCPNIPSDDVPADDENTNDYGPEVGNAPEVDAVPDGFVGTNLVEVPQLTQKVFMPYTQRAKTLNMRNVSNCVWSILTTNEENNKENEEKNSNEVTNPNVKGEKSFAHVFEKLPAKLSKNDAEQVSFAIAFSSLLQVANERCLELKSTPDFSDIIVKQDTPSN